MHKPMTKRLSVYLLFAAALCAGCSSHSHRGSGTSGAATGPHAVDKCPDFSGKYIGVNAENQTVEVSQKACAEITIREVLPGSFDRTYTYRIDGATRTVRQYQALSQPFVAYFQNNSLEFVGRMPRYTSYEFWKLEPQGNIAVYAYAVRDSGEIFNTVSVRYAKVRQAEIQQAD